MASSDRGDGVGAGIGALAVPAGEPLRLSGDARTRGRGQSQGARAADVAAVRLATVARVERARAEGLMDADAADYLRQQRAFHETHDPASLAELGGLAEGLGFAEDDLFAHLHLNLLQVRKASKAGLTDGCSAWAVADGPDGPLLVKNRDISSPDVGIPFVTHHAGPDVATGAMLCVGSMGNPAAYSSGMNQKGLALADTHVPASAPRVGWLRYFLMTRLLAECTSVAEALRMIRGMPHAGGGTLILADWSGALAAVEFDDGAAFVTSGPMVWRTNHFLMTPAADGAPDEDAIGATSRGRFAMLEGVLPGGRWSVGGAAHLMAAHRQDATGSASLCQHPETEGSRTLSCAIYALRSGTLTYSDGYPCRGPWTAYEVGPDHGASTRKMTA